MTLARLDSRRRDFPGRFRALCDRQGGGDDPAVLRAALEIVEDVRTRGDAAVIAATRRLDGWRPRRSGDLEVGRAQLQAALGRVPVPVRRALELAHRRIAAFHRKQREASVVVRERDGSRIEQRVAPLDRVGLYVPGGTARYPSSVLMTAVPAKVAGVREVIMVSPTPGGSPDPALLAAAAVAGVDRVFRVGGAQAVAALAYGTASIPAVDKIVGPGNAYVAAAKRLVHGKVDVDMEAGPSEVLVVADETAEPEWIAADLLAQAEHDVHASAILLSTSAPLIEAVLGALERQLRVLPRQNLARASLAARGAAVLVRDLDEALALANAYAPEHLELMVRRPRTALKQVRAAGAVFLGPYSPEAMGDYVAGPSHVLPTAGTARFGSPLGVHHFLRRQSVIELSPEGFRRLAGPARILAEVEGLHGHARAVALREQRRSSR